MMTRFGWLSLSPLFILPACDNDTTLGRDTEPAALEGVNPPQEEPTVSEVPGDAGEEPAPADETHEQEQTPEPAEKEPAVPKRVFVTRTVYNGALASAAGTKSGLQGGDVLCQAAADAAGLGGKFKAWLSDGSPTLVASIVDAIDRIPDVGPWYQVNASGVRTKVFNNKAHLATSPLEGIRYDEFGSTLVGPVGVWTGTANGGRHSGGACRGFMSSYSGDEAITGTANSVTTWTRSEYSYCNAQKHLYCFEI